jgi:Icc protein
MVKSGEPFHPSAATMSKLIENDLSNDGVDRRGFLKCMAWTGTGVLWALTGGVPRSYALGRLAELTDSQRKSLFFAQISDSHIGFSKAANADVTATLQAAVNKLNGLPQAPAFVLHTGDISQLSKAEEFDTADQVLRSLRTERIFYVPGEHDVLSDNGASYLRRYGKGTLGDGWRSFDHSGVHFIGLVNVMNLKAGGLGALGAAQLDWLRRDVSRLSSSTPIVVYAHIPLWSVYPQWGWGTDDSEQALSLLKRFGSVTVLNGHIHQVLQKVEGHVTFHTALSTAFPQPGPGSAPSPGPMTVDARRLCSFLGVSHATYIEGRGTLATVDSTLSGEPIGDFAPGHDQMVTGKAKAALVLAANQVGIDNFSFTPPVLSVKGGTEVTWINKDDVPHIIVNTQMKFLPSKVLDTDQRFSHTFKERGVYDYYCSIHPKMTGKVIVT